MKKLLFIILFALAAISCKNSEIVRPKKECTTRISKKHITAERNNDTIPYTNKYYFTYGTPGSNRYSVKEVSQQEYNSYIVGDPYCK